MSSLFIICETNFLNIISSPQNHFFKKNFSSHRVLRQMHETLNIDENKN